MVAISVCSRLHLNDLNHSLFDLRRFNNPIDNVRFAPVLPLDCEKENAGAEEDVSGRVHHSAASREYAASNAFFSSSAPDLSFAQYSLSVSLLRS